MISYDVYVFIDICCFFIGVLFLRVSFVLLIDFACFRCLLAGVSGGFWWFLVVSGSFQESLRK